MIARQPSVCVVSICPLDREAYESLLSQRSGALGIGSVFSAELNAKAIWAAMRRKPDLFIVDAARANGAAVEMAEMIRRLSDAARLLVLGLAEDRSETAGWAGADIDGFVAKESGVAELFDALRSLARGSRFFSPKVEYLFARPATAAAAQPRLSPRESELLPLLARGMRLRDAAAKLSVSYKTADAHRTRLLKKLGIRDRVELARYAIRERIIDP